MSVSSKIKGSLPLFFFKFFRGGLLCNNKSKIPILPENFYMILINLFFLIGSDGIIIGLLLDFNWILIEHIYFRIDFDEIFIY